MTRIGIEKSDQVWLWTEAYFRLATLLQVDSNLPKPQPVAKRQIDLDKDMLATIRNISVGKKQVLRGLCYLVPLWIWMGFFLSGFARWPHSPLREERAHYFDKRGHEFTIEEYAAYQHWQNSPFIQYGFVVSLTSLVVVSWVLGLPLISRAPFGASTQTSEGFQRFFPRFIIGVSIATFMLLAWWMFRE